MQKLSEVFFSTEIIEPGKIPLELDKSFIKYTLPGYTLDDLDQLLSDEYIRLEKYLNRVNPLTTAHKKNSEHQTLGHRTAVNHLLRYNALARVQRASIFIANKIKSGAIDNCLIIGLSGSVINYTKICLQQFGVGVIFPGSNPDYIEGKYKKFIKGFSKILILSAGCDFDLDFSNTKNMFFIENILSIDENLKCIKRVCNSNQKFPVTVTNFCLNDPLEIKLSSLIKDAMMAKIKGKHFEQPLPEEFL